MQFGGVYCASKHAVAAISETLRAELEAMALPIGVTVACPALVPTPMAEVLFTLAQADDALAEHLLAHLSMQQLRAQLSSGWCVLVLDVGGCCG